MTKLRVSKRHLETYTEFHISVRGPKGSYSALRKNVQTFESLLRQGIAAYSQVARQLSTEEHIVVTIQ